MLQLHKSQENVFITECYAKYLGEVGGEKAHHLLHTSYQSRRRIAEEVLPLMQARGGERTKVSVCLGTNCYLKGSQELLNSVLRHAQETGLENRMDVRAAFCLEECEHGPNALIDGKCVHHCTPESVIDLLDSRVGSEDTRER
jgi:NADH-quinone oxidoreductase subunit G